MTDLSQRVRLERPRLHPLFRDRVTVLTESLPFVYSRAGQYAHRVRSACIHTCLGKAHAAYRWRSAA